MDRVKILFLLLTGIFIFLIGITLFSCHDEELNNYVQSDCYTEPTCTKEFHHKSESGDFTTIVSLWDSKFYEVGEAKKPNYDALLSFMHNILPDQRVDPVSIVLYYDRPISSYSKLIDDYITGISLIIYSRKKLFQKNFYKNNNGDFIELKEFSLETDGLVHNNFAYFCRYLTERHQRGSYILYIDPDSRVAEIKSKPLLNNKVMIYKLLGKRPKIVTNSSNRNYPAEPEVEFEEGFPCPPPCPTKPHSQCRSRFNGQTWCKGALTPFCLLTEYYDESTTLDSNDKTNDFPIYYEFRDSLLPGSDFTWRYGVYFYYLKENISVLNMSSGLMTDILAAIPDIKSTMQVINEINSNDELFTSNDTLVTSDFAEDMKNIIDGLYNMTSDSLTLEILDVTNSDIGDWENMKVKDIFTDCCQ